MKIGLIAKFNKILEDKKNLHPSSVTYEIERRKWIGPEDGVDENFIER